MRKVLLNLVTLGSAAGLALILWPGSASACTATMTGTATCGTNGKYTAVYTVHAYSGQQTGTFVFTSDQGQVGMPQTVTLPGRQTFDMTVNEIQGTATATTLTMHASWTNGESKVIPATVALGGNCTAVPTTTTTTAPPATPTTTTPTTPAPSPPAAPTAAPTVPPAPTPVPAPVSITQEQAGLTQGTAPNGQVITGGRG